MKFTKFVEIIKRIKIRDILSRICSGCTITITNTEKKISVSMERGHLLKKQLVTRAKSQSRMKLKREVLKILTLEIAYFMHMKSFSLFYFSLIVILSYSLFLLKSFNKLIISFHTLIYILCLVFKLIYFI